MHYRAMAVDMNDRFPTVRDFWQALTAQPLAQQPPAPLVIPASPAPQSRPTAVNRPNPSPTVTPSSSPAPAGAPNVAGTYNGMIVDDIGPTKGTMSLSIQQQQGSISGTFTVSGGLIGSGPFTGFVTNKDHIQFTVQSSGVNPLFFYGSVQSHGGLAGSYCSLDSTGHCNPAAGGYGTWSVSPTSSGSASASIWSSYETWLS